MNALLSDRRLARSSTSRALTEQLESRRLMAVTLGSQAIVNPGAESNTGSTTGNDVITPNGWTRNGNATVIKYGTAAGFPTASSPGPQLRGVNFFAGGPNNDASDFFQIIDASNISSQIDANQINYTLSAFLGGFTSQTDNASVFLNFRDSGGFFIDQVSVGPVTPAQRSNATGMLLRSTTGKLPVGTRQIQVQIHFTGGSGSYNDGYADTLSLIMTGPSTTSSVAGKVFNDTTINGVFDSGETGKSGVKVFLDKNNNGVLDTTEQSATSNANGDYKISNVPAGSYQLRQLAVAGFRTVSFNPVAITVSAGQTITGKNFGVSDTAKFSGTVFNDTNNNKTKDTGEAGVANVLVYLDFNNNGQFDSFELSKRTDASGNYTFVVPFGTYIVRIVPPAGKTQTTPTTGFTLTLTKGQVATGKLFGIK